MIEDPANYTYIRPEGAGLMVGLFEGQARSLFRFVLPLPLLLRCWWWCLRLVFPCCVLQLGVQLTCYCLNVACACIGSGMERGLHSRRLCVWRDWVCWPVVTLFVVPWHGCTLACCLHGRPCVEASASYIVGACRMQGKRRHAQPVSYTHLTLPTNREV